MSTIFSKIINKEIPSYTIAENENFISFLDIRVGVSVVGLEVPHAHLHLIPFINEQDMSFSNKRIQMTNEEFLDLQSRIIKNLN